MSTSRRSFIKVLLLSTAGITKVSRLFAKTTKSKLPDLVAIKDGSPAQMFEVGIKAYGGIERFVKQGQTVVVKPNIGWNRTSTEGANTQPDLVEKIVELSYKAGAKKVYVFDNTCNDMDECYKNSGIKKAVQKAGGEMYPSDDEKYYRPKEIPGGKILKKALIHKLYLDADVVINVPVLKSHSGARMTSSIKNLMGVIWDRRFWHREGLHQCIADFGLYKKVTLNVIDAYYVMTRNGPRGISTNDLELKKMQLISTDMILADTAAAKILGLSPNDIAYLGIAEKLGIGSMKLKSAKIKKISVKSS